MGISLGQAAPDFNLPGVDGKNYKLDDFTGKPFVVVFSCNHCPYVIAYEERMIQIANEYMPKGVGFIAINANNVVTHPQDSFENMRKRAQQKNFPFLYLYNEDQLVAHAYGAVVTPHAYLFDEKGILRYIGAIDDSYNDEDKVKVHYLKNAIDAVLAGTPDDISPKETKPVGCSVKWK